MYTCRLTTCVKGYLRTHLVKSSFYHHFIKFSVYFLVKSLLSWDIFNLCGRWDPSGLIQCLIGLRYSLVPPVNKRVFSSELRAEMGADVKIVLTTIIPPRIIILCGPMCHKGETNFTISLKIELYLEFESLRRNSWT